MLPFRFFCRRFLHFNLYLLFLCFSAGDIYTQRLLRDALYYSGTGGVISKIEREYSDDDAEPGSRLLLLVEPGKEMRYRQEKTYELGDTTVTERVYGHIRRTPTRTEQFLAADAHKYEFDNITGYTTFSYYRKDIHIGDTSVRIDPRAAENYRSVLVRSLIRRLRNSRLQVDVSPPFRTAEFSERFYRVNGNLQKTEWLNASGNVFYRVRYVWNPGSLLRIYENLQKGNVIAEQTDTLSWSADSSQIRIQVRKESGKPADDYTLKIRRNRIRRYNAGDKRWTEETVYFGKPDLFALITGSLPGKGDVVRYDMPCEGMPRVKRRFLAEGTVYTESYRHFAFSAVFHSQTSRRNGFTKGEVRYYYYR